MIQILNITFRLNDDRSCCGCPMLNKYSWNETWTCALNFSSVKFEVDGLRRPRPEKCVEYFEKNNTFNYKEN